MTSERDESHKLSLGFSPCPNDTFLFYALLHARVATWGLAFRERLLDVETLNALALRGELDVTKVSYGAYPELEERYSLLRAGGALGRGCGPLVVAREPRELSSLRGARVAIPGVRTTAYLLLRLCDPEVAARAVPMPFDRIIGAVARGEVDAGLIIHESRFTYAEQGLHCILDLGEWWERETGCLIPLGCIIARRALGNEKIALVERAVAASVGYALDHPDEPMEYVKRHSQELSDEVVRAHIALYVNEYSRDFGEDGRKAVETLLRMARTLA